MIAPLSVGPVYFSSTIASVAVKNMQHVLGIRIVATSAGQNLSSRICRQPPRAACSLLRASSPPSSCVLEGEERKLEGGEGKRRLDPGRRFLLPDPFPCATHRSTHHPPIPPTAASPTRVSFVFRKVKTARTLFRPSEWTAGSAR